MDHYVKSTRKSLEDELSKQMSLESAANEDDELEKLNKELEELRKETEKEEKKLSLTTKRVKQKGIKLKESVGKLEATIAATNKRNAKDAEDIASLRAKMGDIKTACASARRATPTSGDSSTSVSQKVTDLRQKVLNNIASTKQAIVQQAKLFATEDWRLRVQEIKDISGAIAKNEADMRRLNEELDSTKLANGLLTDELVSLQEKKVKTNEELNESMARLAAKENTAKELKEKVTELEVNIESLSCRKEELVQNKIARSEKQGALQLKCKELEFSVKQAQQDLSSTVANIEISRANAEQFSEALALNARVEDLQQKLERSKKVKLLRDQLEEEIDRQKNKESEIQASIEKLNSDIAHESRSLDSKNATANELESSRCTKTEALQIECENLKTAIFETEESCSYGDIKKSQLQSSIFVHDGHVKDQIDYIEKAIASAKKASSTSTKVEKNRKSARGTNRKNKGQQNVAEDIPVATVTTEVAEKTPVTPVVYEPPVIDLLDDTIEFNVKQEIIHKEAPEAVVLRNVSPARPDSLDGSIMSSDGEDDEIFVNHIGSSQPVVQSTARIPEVQQTGVANAINDSLFASDVDSDDEEDEFFGASHAIQSAVKKPEVPLAQGANIMNDSLFASDVGSDDDDDTFLAAPTSVLDNTFAADAHTIVASTPIFAKKRSETPEDMIEKPSASMPSSKRGKRKNQPSGASSRGLLKMNSDQMETTDELVETRRRLLAQLEEVDDTGFRPWRHHQ